MPGLGLAAVLASDAAVQGLARNDAMSSGNTPMRWTATGGHARLYSLRCAPSPGCAKAAVRAPAAKVMSQNTTKASV